MFASARTIFRSYLTSAGRLAARNLFWLGLYSLAGQGCALGVVFLLTSALGRPAFGVVASALTFQAYLLKLGCLGIKQIVVRDGAQDPGRLDITSTSHLVVTGVASTVVGLLAVVVIWLIEWGQWQERVLLTILAAGNIAACLNIRPLFDVHHQQPKAALVTFVSELFGLLMVALLYASEQLTLPLIGLSFALKWLIACVGQHVVYHYRVRRLRWQPSKADMVQVVRSSWPILLTLLITSVPMTSGVFLVRLMVGDDETAILGLAQQVAMAYTMVLGLCSRILEPHIAGRYGVHRGFVRKLVLFVVGISAVLMVAAVAGVFVLLEYVIDQQYRAAMLPICCMLLAAVIVNLGRVGSMYLVVLRCETSVFYANAIAAVVFAILSVMLIPVWGALGSAVASVVAAALGNGMIIVQTRNSLTRL